MHKGFVGVMWEGREKVEIRLPPLRSLFPWSRKEALPLESIDEIIERLEPSQNDIKYVANAFCKEPEVIQRYIDAAKSYARSKHARMQDEGIFALGQVYHVATYFRD